MFSLNGPVYRTLSTFSRYLLLNILFLISCIFIVTIPPATAGLFAMTKKYSNREEPPLCRTFWHEFKENFIQSWTIYILFTPIFLILGIDIHLFLINGWTYSGAALVIILFISLLTTSTFIHIFTLMAHTKLTTLNLVKNALKLNLIKPHLTVLNLVVLVLLTFFASKILILLPTIYFSVSAAITYRIAKAKFTKIISSQRDTESEPI
ncbi:YesL family protein [Alicyclobacillus fastidiosus]|uniref:YesL family protein n=1 Tax=Alicyclobacillus fastidiosus TaxID=392011 RepID=UPI0034D3E262